MNLNEIEEKVLRKVAEKQKEAEGMGLPDLLYFIFFEYGCINAWQAWLENNPSGYGDSLRKFTGVIRVTNKDEEGLECSEIVTEKFEITLKAGNWNGGFDPDDENSFGEVQVHTTQCNVIYKVKKTTNKYGLTTYKMLTLKRLIGDHWLLPLRTLRDGIERMLSFHDAKRAQEVREKKIKEMIENFDLHEINENEPNK